MNKLLKLLFLATALAGAPAQADVAKDSGTYSAAEQFALISSWEGRWQVAEASGLEINFEKAARGTAMIERWETKAGLHSITVYHMDGDALIATHYCPQGNQPRLKTHGSDKSEIRFTFRDATDLQAGESHAHGLWFVPNDDGTLVRTEVYADDDGLQEPSSLTLKRVQAAN